jgi:hypothetical protein
MAVSLTLTILGALLAAPFAWTILHAETPGQVLWQWLALLATALALWLLCTLVFHSGLITAQRARVIAALVINLFWVGLVVATFLGSAAAVVRAAQLRRRLRTSGK